MTLIPKELEVSVGLRLVHVQVLVHVTNILMLILVHHMSYMGSTHAHTVYVMS